MTLQLFSILKFLIYEENLIFFYQCGDNVSYIFFHILWPSSRSSALNMHVFVCPINSPLWFSIYMRKIWFSFLSVQAMSPISFSYFVAQEPQLCPEYVCICVSHKFPTLNFLIYEENLIFFFISAGDNVSYIFFHILWPRSQLCPEYACICVSHKFLTVNKPIC